MASKYLTLGCFIAHSGLLSLMNLAVFSPFNINSAELCTCPMGTTLHKLKRSEFQDAISRVAGAARKSQVPAVHRDVIAQAFSLGVEGLECSPLYLPHAFGISPRTCILLVCAEPSLAASLSSLWLLRVTPPSWFLHVWLLVPSPKTQLHAEERLDNNRALVPQCLLSPSLQSDDLHGKNSHLMSVLDKACPRSYTYRLGEQHVKAR